MKASRESLRDIVNRVLIDSNPVIKREQRRFYRIHGRPDWIVDRFILSMSLYVKHSVLKIGTKDALEKKQRRLPYPESQMGQTVSGSEWLKRIDDAETIIFDLFGTLLFDTVDENQLLAFAETMLGIPGLLDRYYGKTLPDSVAEKVASLRAAMLLENRAMRRLWDHAEQIGKTPYMSIHCDPRYIPAVSDRLKELVLSVRIWDRKIPSGALYIHSSDDKNGYLDPFLSGEIYRPIRYQSNVIDSIYRTIVNVKLHGEFDHKDLFYEYGFTCGGILTAGFCQYIDGLAAEEGIDKLIFVARDGDILIKTYRKYFGTIPSDYMVFSRFASLELMFDLHPEEYVDQNIRPRLARRHADNTLGAILRECGLEDFVPALTGNGLSPDDILTWEGCDELTKRMKEHHAEISASFGDSQEAACQYFKGLFGDAKHVCIVDLGWHGRSAVYLRMLMKQYGWDGRITGAVIGLMGDSVPQDHIRSGLLHTYAFENDYWRRIGHHRVKRLGHDETIAFEALFSSTEDTLLRYAKDKDGKTCFIYGKPNTNRSKIADIHRGISDFCDEFMPFVRRYGLVITATDAYLPLDTKMANPVYRKMICDRYDEPDQAMNGF